MPISNWSRYQNRWDHLKGLQFHKVPGRKTVDILIASDYTELSLALEVFGDRASPFLAQYVMRRHAEELQNEYKLAAEVVLMRIYMDDVLDSADTINEALQTRKELVELLGQAGFTIRRWCSNKAEVLEGIPKEDRASGLKLNDKGPDIEHMEMTKRGLLSRVATLFDPLQMAAPFTIRAKIALQDAWLEGLVWDEEFSGTLRTTVEKWLQELDRLDGIQILRCYRRDSTFENVSLHTLTDASKAAYAAVTYARHEYEDGSVDVTFVAAKAKVTPIKAVNLPALRYTQFSGTQNPFRS
ncbi:hypothetical protein AC249_AIPGENE2091 [Exaiptasia diaphana]|nr:hypothetical protein AC249_AIPGENE2091 [Exaiptasia diaphana]